MYNFDYTLPTEEQTHRSKTYKIIQQVHYAYKHSFFNTFLSIHIKYLSLDTSLVIIHK